MGPQSAMPISPKFDQIPARLTALAGFRQMSTALESLEQQYAAEVLKVNADEDLLKRLERGIRGLREVAEPTGQCSVETHCHIRSEDSQSNLTRCGLCRLLFPWHQVGLLYCIVSEQNNCRFSASSVA